MRAVDQWLLIERDLRDDWEEARLTFAVEDPGAVASAAGVLGPLGPGRAGNELRFQIRHSGSGGPELLKNLLRVLDRKRIWGTLSLVDTRESAAAPAEPEPEQLHRREPLADAWDTAVAALPPGWNDLLCELELDSSDYLATAALLGAPLNPTRVPDAVALRFRAAGSRGYGAPAGMVRRCLERMDDAGLTGTLTVLNALSETDNVATQGPVWRLAGRSV
jgi:hypothetical protein